MCLKNLFKRKPKPQEKVDPKVKIEQDTETIRDDNENWGRIEAAINDNEAAYKEKARIAVQQADHLIKAIEKNRSNFLKMVLKKEQDCAAKKAELDARLETEGKNIATKGLYNDYKRTLDAFEKQKKALKDFENSLDLAKKLQTSLETLLVGEKYKTIVKLINPMTFKMLNGLNDSEDSHQLAIVLENIYTKMNDMSTSISEVVTEVNNIEEFSNGNLDDEWDDFDDYVDEKVNVANPITNDAHNNAGVSAGTANAANTAKQNQNS